MIVENVIIIIIGIMAIVAFFISEPDMTIRIKSSKLWKNVPYYDL